MTAKLKLTDAQHRLLAAAKARTDGHVIGGDPRTRAVLASRGLIEVYDHHFGPLYQITKVGRTAMEHAS